MESNTQQTMQQLKTQDATLVKQPPVSTLEGPTPGSLKPEQTVTTQRKHIMDSWGGKWVKGFVWYGLGFIGNSAASVGITYYVNPKQWAKNIRGGASSWLNHKISRVTGVRKGEETGLAKYVSDGVRSGLEILFMMISGTIVTLIMTPLVIKQEKIAYRLNQWFQKDTDILPESMIKKPEPVTIEEKIIAEVNKRVNKEQSGTDLWKSRFASMGAVIVGDQIVNATNRKLENINLPSLDTAIWRGGQQLYRILPRKITDAQARWFDAHGAGMKDIKASMKDQFDRLEGMEKTAPGSDGRTLNEPRMVVTEQSRLLTKEVGWTFILARWVDKWTEGFRRRRVQRQTLTALDKMQKQGFIPHGYEALLEPDGKVTVTGPKDAKSAAGKTPKIAAEAAEQPLTGEKPEKEYRPLSAQSILRRETEENASRKVESRKEKPLEPRPERHSDAVYMDNEAMVPIR